MSLGAQAAGGTPFSAAASVPTEPRQARQAGSSPKTAAALRATVARIDFDLGLDGPAAAAAAARSPGGLSCCDREAALAPRVRLDAPALAEWFRQWAARTAEARDPSLRSAFLHPIEVSGDFVLGLTGSRMVMLGGKGHVSLFPYFVHSGKMPRHFDWMQECTSSSDSSSVPVLA